MKTTASNRKLRKLITAIKEKQLIPRPEFQRRLVWANKHKVAFLETVLSDYPFPEIYIAAGDVDIDTGEGTEMLVDGQQRITTLYQYFYASKELVLGGKIPAYVDLDPEAKKAFLEYDVVVRDMGSLSIDEIKEVFLRINSTNYAVNAMEIHNARFEGEFISFAEEIADHEIFVEHGVFSANEVRRMQDLRFVLVLLVTFMSTYFNRDEELESYLTAYNEDFPKRKQWKKQIEQVLDFVERLNFSKDSRVWKKADLFSLLVELFRITVQENTKLGLAKTRSKLDAFYSKIDGFSALRRPTANVRDYHKAAVAATNDKGSRIVRGDIVRSILLE